MGTQYDFSIKDAEDALSVDAGIEGWDAVVQINNVITRRYASSTPMSLISRLVDFRGTSVDGGNGGIQLDTSGYLPLLDIGSLSSGTSNARNLLFIPTMVGLMLHPQTGGAMGITFSASIVVRTASNQTALLTSSFPLTPSASTPDTASFNGVNPMGTPNGQSSGVFPQPTSVPTAPINGAGIRRGYYYLCPINKGWLQHSGGNVCGGVPLRGFTIQNSSISPFIPDGDTADADISYAGSLPFRQIGLLANGTGGTATNTARFAIVDLYGIIIPSASAAV
jgi:hypothetical protein